MTRKQYSERSNLLSVGGRDHGKLFSYFFPIMEKQGRPSAPVEKPATGDSFPNTAWLGACPPELKDKIGWLVSRPVPHTKSVPSVTWAIGVLRQEGSGWQG
jgi:hypothetical protein